MSGQTANCMDCDHGWCILVLTLGDSYGPERGIECRETARIAWQGKTYPTFITPPDWCPLRKEASRG